MQVCEDGMLREGEFVGVALSSRYGTVGNKYTMKLSSGQELKVVMIDIKAEKDLDNNCTDKSGAMIEFVVDTNLIDRQVMLSGSFDCIYEGQIEKMKKEN